jgi:hypothetical protein
MARTKKDSWITTVEVDNIKIQRAIGYVMALVRGLVIQQAIAKAAIEFSLSLVEIALLTVELDSMFDSSGSEEIEPVEPEVDVLETIFPKKTKRSNDLNTIPKEGAVLI